MENVEEPQVKISFVGDVLPANLPYTIDYGNYDKLNSQNFNSLEKQSDIFFANLESPILANSSGKTPFSGNPRIIDFFHRIGINIVTIANNHILEQGADGFHETVRLLRENGIKVVGINEKNTSNIEYFDIENIRIGFAAFNGVHDIKNPGLYAELNESGIALALENMGKGNASFKILSFHWGNEYIETPSVYQLELARFAIHNGCDLIIGHHPHIIQKYEVIDNKHVFYSLGNAYFDYLFTNSVKIGLRVDCRVTKSEMKLDYYCISSASLGFNRIAGDSAKYLLNDDEKKACIDKAYGAHYLDRLKKIRLRYRIKMKLFMFALLFSLPIKQKYVLIRNIGSALISKIVK